MSPNRRRARSPRSPSGARSSPGIRSGSCSRRRAARASCGAISRPRPRSMPVTWRWCWAGPIRNGQGESAVAGCPSGGLGGRPGGRGRDDAGGAGRVGPGARPSRGERRGRDARRARRPGLASRRRGSARRRPGPDARSRDDRRTDRGVRPVRVGARQATVAARGRPAAALTGAPGLDLPARDRRNDVDDGIGRDRPSRATPGRPSTKTLMCGRRRGPASTSRSRRPGTVASSVSMTAADGVAGDLVAAVDAREQGEQRTRQQDGGHGGAPDLSRRGRRSRPPRSRAACR